MMLCIMQAATEQAASAAADAGQEVLADEGLLLHMAPYIILGISFVMGTVLFGSPDQANCTCRFIGSKVVFWTTAKQAADAADGDGSSSAAAAADAAGTSPAGSKKKVRKLQQQAQQALAGAQGSTGMLQAGYLYPDLITRLEFTEDLEYLLRGTCVVAVNLVAALLFRIFLTPTMPARAIMLLVSGWVFIVRMLYKVEWAHQVIRSDEKLYIAGAAVLGGVAAFSLLVVVPPGALAFNIPAASEEFTVRVAAVVRQRIKSLPAGALQPVAEAGPLGTGLALLAGALAGLLLAPGIRYGRVLSSFLDTPTWAHALRPKALDRVLARAGFALQLLLTPLWVSSMVEVLRLPAGSLPILRGVLMLAAAVLQARMVPCLLQAFMYHTPLHAHVVTRNPVVPDELKAKSVKNVTTVTLSQASKVCVQLLVVPVTLLACGLGYLLMAFPSPLAAASPFAQEWDKRPSDMLMSVAGFIGWWASSVYMLWASLGVLLAKVGAASS